MVWIAIILIVVVGFVGLALDWAFVLLVNHQLQNAADASALAAVQLVRTDIGLARQAAVNIALANTAAKDPLQLALNAANAAGGDIVVGRYDRSDGSFAPTLDFPNAVKVVARRTDASAGGELPILFGPVFGTDSVNVERPAIAMIGGGTGGGIITLCDECECSLRVNGSPNVDVNDAPIHVNSVHFCAVCGQGSAAFIDAPSLDVVGDVCWSGDPNIPPVNDAEPISDPLDFLAPPTWAPGSDLGAISLSGGDSEIHGPGYYSGGASVNNGTLTLDEGIYILDGVGLDIQGSSTLIAEKVMLYVTGSGVVDIAGTGVIRITPPEIGPFEQVSIFQARGPGGDFNENGGCGKSRIIGTSLLDIHGTLYFPCADLEIGGEGDGFGNQLISWNLWIHGTGDLVINFDGNEVAPGDSIFLVR